MIDEFQRIAQSIRVLLLPLLLVGLVCLVTVIVIVMGAGPENFERFLTPSVLGFIWAATTCSFIVTFCEIPEKAGRSQGIVEKLRRSVRRGWYWVIALVFLGSTVAVVIFTGRLLSIWL